MLNDGKQLQKHFERPMYSSLHKFSQENVRGELHDLLLCRGWMVQWENDPKVENNEKQCLGKPNWDGVEWATQWN